MYHFRAPRLSVESGWFVANVVRSRDHVESSSCLWLGTGGVMMGAPCAFTVIRALREIVPWRAVTVTAPGTPGSFRIAASESLLRNAPPLVVQSVDVRTIPLPSASKPWTPSTSWEPSGESAEDGVRSRRARAPGETVTVAFARITALARTRTTHVPTV